MQIKGRLTEASGRAWDKVATTEGVTMTALLEALGRALESGAWKPSRRVIEEARRIDAERRSR